MLLLSPFLLALCSLLAPAPSYQAIVVDATTGRPLPGVSVLDVRTQAGSATDARGRFSLPGSEVRFHLHTLGFADLEATRPVLAAGQVDTLRLLPEAILLSEVSVRPAKPVVLSSLGTKVGKTRGQMIVPGHQFGVLFRPDGNVLPAIAQQITIRFHVNKQSHEPIGRVRVRLVAVQRGSSMSPSANDLLPIAATFTAAELAALPNQLLTIDLSAYNLRLPASGFFVLVEGLPTIPGESYVANKLEPRNGKLVALIVTATDPNDPATFRETPAFDYPAISRTASITDVQTLVRLGYDKPWHYTPSGHDSKKTENVDISLTILAE